MRTSPTSRFVQKAIAVLGIFLAALAWHFHHADATDYESTDFIVRNPVISAGAGYSSSADFQQYTNTGQTVIGLSTDSTFTIESGFLYLPVGTTTGTGTTTTTGTTGTTSTTGTTGTTTTTGTTGSGGTTTTGTTTSGGGSTGGSAGNGSKGFGSQEANVTFSGRAYPLSKVILLKDGQEVLDTISGPDAKFEFSTGALDPGTYTFSILSQDSAGRRSTLFTVPVLVTAGYSTTISGIFLSPTIAVDKQEVKRGDTLTIFGETAPGSQVTISVHSAVPYFLQTTADEGGAYLYHFDTSPLEYGLHNTQSKTELVATNEVAPYGSLLSFTVGAQTISSPSDVCSELRGDFNNDCRVNLIDFSILAYWYGKSNVPASVDLNGNGEVDFGDFSIIAYYWTG